MKKKKTLSFQNSGITDSPDEKLEQVGAFYTYRRTRATRSINRRVASRRPTATNMVLHLFLAKVERKLDYSRAKLPSDVGRREKRPTVEVPLLADSQSTTLPFSFPHYFLLLFCHSLVASLWWIDIFNAGDSGVRARGCPPKEDALPPRRYYCSLERARVAVIYLFIAQDNEFPRGRGSSNISGGRNKRGGRHP